MTTCQCHVPAKTLKLLKSMIINLGSEENWVTSQFLYHDVCAQLFSYKSIMDYVFSAFLWLRSQNMFKFHIRLCVFSFSVTSNSNHIYVNVSMRLKIGTSSCICYACSHILCYKCTHQIYKPLHFETHLLS